MKRTLLILMSVLMIISVLTGCGKTPAQTPSSSSNPPETKGTSETQGIGTPDNPVKVTILEKDVSPSDPNVQAFAEAIEKGMAAQGNYVDIEYLEAPAGKYIEVVPIALRTGQYTPDIVYFQNGVELPLVHEGLLEDLTPYIENSTHVKANLEAYNWARLEKYPYLLWIAPPMTYVPYIRGDWFSQLDVKDDFLADPSIDNYYRLFKELKEKGFAEYPLTTDNNKLRLEGVFNHAFGITSTIMKDGDNYIFYHVSDGERAKLEWLHKLYEEGLFDPEFITNTWDVMEQKFYEGKSAVISGRAGDVGQIHDTKMIQTNGEGSALEVLPPAKGVSWAYASVDVTREPRGFAISVDSKVKNAAFAIFEYISSPEGRVLDRLGIEGIHHKVENGKTVLTEEFSSWWALFFESVKTFDPNPPMEGSIYTPAAAKSLDMIMEYYAEDVNIIIPEELAPKWDAMINLYNEYYADIIRGVKPVSSFDQFVKEWNAAGGDEFSSYLAEILQ
mgnify:CR=1 FL=1